MRWSPKARNFPDYSLIVGSPAKAIRTLDEAARDRHLDSAKHYVENGQRYASGLTLIG